MAKTAKKTYFNEKNVRAQERPAKKYQTSNIMIGAIVLIFLILFDSISIIVLQLPLLSSLIVLVVSIVMYIVLLLTLGKTNYAGIRARKGKNDVIKAIVNEVAKKDDNKEMIGDFKYVGSSQTKTYHIKECRLAKQIKPRFRLENNSESFFIKNKFKAHSCVK